MMDGMRAVLRHRDFRLLWAASSASTLGDHIVFVALALYVTEIGSPSDVGIVLAAHAIPLVLFVLIGGVWADRVERHRLMIVTDVVRATLHGTLAILIFIGDVPIWAIVVIEAGFGTAEAFFNPAATGLLPQTVPEVGASPVECPLEGDRVRRHRLIEAWLSPRRMPACRSTIVARPHGGGPVVLRGRQPQRHPGQLLVRPGP